MFWLFASVVLIASVAVESRVYQPCELGRELMNRWSHFFNRNNIHTWVCIAREESRYNTRAVGPPNQDQSRDYGIFQINNRYWCSPPGTGCRISCQQLLTDRIDEDVACVQIIYRQQGLTAWTTYNQRCRDDNYARQFTRNCGF